MHVYDKTMTRLSGTPDGSGIRRNLEPYRHTSPLSQRRGLDQSPPLSAGAPARAYLVSDYQTSRQTRRLVDFRRRLQWNWLIVDEPSVIPLDQSGRPVTSIVHGPVSVLYAIDDLPLTNLVSIRVPENEGPLA